LNLGKEFLLSINFRKKIIFIPNCIPRAGNHIDPAPRPSRHIPGATNPRSSAFICGFFIVDAPKIKIPLQKRTRMAWIGRIFTYPPIRANPRHPRNPRSIVILLFAKAPEINNSLFIMFINNLMQKILSPVVET
jgi:hypothetical protein